MISVGVNNLLFAKSESRGTVGADMNLPMAYTAERDEIFFHISSQLAARLHMMNL